MSIYKDSKRNTWYFRTYSEDKYGNKKQKCQSGFKTKSEAKIAEQVFVNESNKSYSDITFEELYKEFILHKSQNLKPQSKRSTISKFSNHILPYFKDYKINKIDQRVYLNWKASIIEKGFGYKYNSSLHGSMVTILNYACDFYNLEKNIASKVGNFTKQNYIRKIDFWTYEEFNQFIKEVDNEQFKILYHTLYYTGMRLGECLALNWSDYKNDHLSISKTLAKEQINGLPIITTPKTKSSIRDIKLDENTIDYLNQLKEHYKNYIGFNDDWYIFGGLNPLSQTTVGRRKDIYCKKAHVKQIKIHDLRHSHASLLLSKNIPVSVISKRLGHADMAMTLNTYSHMMPDDENKAVDILNLIQKSIQLKI